MTEIKDMNPERAQVFFKQQKRVHVSKKNGSFYNGVITELGSDFFFIKDEKGTNQLVFFSEINKPIEEFKEIGK